MTHGTHLRMQNQHIKIVLIPVYDDDGYSVDRVTNILQPKPGSSISEKAAQELIDLGYTVVSKTLNSQTL